ncbi:hypothetical protein SynPROS91_00614 [Synechococcus sp. PROS-9-1]|uniref:hypothetical protein n=1 Tax=Synechococcus sp. PROS-9-1 TaxID=1968775 RepID=UPI001646B3A4|nr:hypothetical protein [Synechococcus sp. PROS-9-1]QNJ31015.1 hypothetical protein SynPROS91_00614 [Synechococcus sp. PROS-9-1]
MRHSDRDDREDDLSLPPIGIGSAPNAACCVVWTIASSPVLKLRVAGALLPVSAFTCLLVLDASHSPLYE